MQSTKMTEQAGRKTDPIGKASGNLEKALETMSRQLLVQIRQGQAPCKDLGELAKVMKQAVEIRQELRGEQDGGKQTGGVKVVIAQEAEAYAQ